MKRPDLILLSLVGGGLALTIGGGIALLGRESADCRLARAQGDPNAEQFCRGGGSFSSGDSFGRRLGWDGGGSRTSSPTRRGGFGSTGHSWGS